MKMKRFLPCISLVLVLLSGCSSTDYVIEQAKQIAGPVLDEVIQKELGGSENENLPVPALKEEKVINPARLVELAGFSEDAFYYKQLSDEEQTVYLEILSILTDRLEEGNLSTLQEDCIAKVFRFVMNDHPELFYVEGYVVTSYSKGGVVTRNTLSGNYNRTEEEIQRDQAAIEKYVQILANGIDATCPSYEKVKYVYEYLITHTDYDLNAPDNQNIASVFLNGSSVCNGYAKSTQYILNRLEIPATIVNGVVSKGGDHAWNMVWIDGTPYYVDTTWGDASYQINENAKMTVDEIPEINYDFLCVTTEQLCSTHQIDGECMMPVCESMEDNYYVREGAYFTSVDQEGLQSLFDRYYAEGRSYLTCRCADSASYEKMRSYLLTDQHVFDFLRQKGSSVAYVENEEQYSISFWL